MAALLGGRVAPNYESQGGASSVYEEREPAVYSLHQHEKVAVKSLIRKETQVVGERGGGGGSCGGFGRLFNLVWMLISCELRLLIWPTRVGCCAGVKGCPAASC